MNAIQCPRCSVVNPALAIECRQCHFPFGNLPPTAFVDIPENDFSGSQSLNSQVAVLPESSQTGRRTYFWYRIYCSVLVVLYAVIAIVGAMAMAGSYSATVENPHDAFKGGVILLIFGAVFAVVYLAGVILSPKPASWIFGIVLIALGMTSICLLPLVLPLIFFWLKPETRTYFGRR